MFYLFCETSALCLARCSSHANILPDYSCSMMPLARTCGDSIDDVITQDIWWLFNILPHFPNVDKWTARCWRRAIDLDRFLVILLSWFRQIRLPWFLANLHLPWFRQILQCFRPTWSWSRWESRHFANLHLNKAPEQFQAPCAQIFRPSNFGWLMIFHQQKSKNKWSLPAKGA